MLVYTDCRLIDWLLQAGLGQCWCRNKKRSFRGKKQKGKKQTSKNENHNNKMIEKLPSFSIERKPLQTRFSLSISCPSFFFVFYNQPLEVGLSIFVLPLARSSISKH